MLALTIPIIACVCATVAVASDADDRPNIIFILADDLGIGDVACYGGERCRIPTPNIDALAERGIRFTDAHANASVCMPTRRAIMTGRYSWRFAGPRQSGPWGFVGPAQNLQKHTLAKLFRRAGYHTGYVGKWHLGTVMTTTDGKPQGTTNVDYSQPLILGPVQFGFDHSFILPGSLDMYPYAFVRNNRWQGDVSAQKGWSAFHRVGPAATDFRDDQVLETFYREAEQYIAQRTNDERFFLYLALTAPHTPVSPSRRWLGKSSMGIYGDFVMEVDHAVARIDEALRKRGLFDNTLVLFSSDHGPAPYAGDVRKATPAQIKRLESRGHFPSGPYRGYKFSIYEGGLRVPLIARWPGVTEHPSTCDALIGLCDLYATFADILGQTTSPDEAPDSISFAPLLHHPDATPTRHDLVLESTMHFAIRNGDWKLCLTPGCGMPAGFEVGAGNEPTPEKAWRDVLDHFGKRPAPADLWKPPFVQLFDLADDPHEDHNVADQHPQVVNQMVNLLIHQVNSGRCTPGPRQDNDRDVQIINPNDKRLPEFVRNAVIHP